MDGYKIVYRQPDGAISDTFLGQPITNISLPESCYKEVVMQFFAYAHPGCEMISIERCSFEEFRK